MRNIGVFELIGGKTVITRYEWRTSDDGTGVDYLIWEKPLELQPFRDQQGRHGVMMVDLVGLSPECRVYTSAIAATNLDKIDKTLYENYIKTTTGIYLAPSNDPPPIAL